MDRRQFLSMSAVGATLGILPGIGAAFGRDEYHQPCVPLSPLPSPPSEATTRTMFPGFASHSVKTGGAEIFALTGGSGPPLLLIHGHPETHSTWHKIAADLARDYTVVIPDLRGYGDSSKPDGGDRHINYSFRAMAEDQVETMRHFGHDKFFVAGHDRGARAAHRLCLDHPESVHKVCVMDIAPTLTMYADTNKEFATRYVCGFFRSSHSPCPNTSSV
jgi:haloacetate dehalogenase